MSNAFGLRPLSTFLFHASTVKIGNPTVRGVVNNGITSKTIISEVEYLLDQVEKEDASPYITDFGIHLAIKLFVNSIEYFRHKWAHKFL